MNLENILLSEINQTGKNKYQWYHIYVNLKIIIINNITVIIIIITCFKSDS